MTVIVTSFAGDDPPTSVPTIVIVSFCANPVPVFVKVAVYVAPVLLISITALAPDPLVVYATLV